MDPLYSLYVTDAACRGEGHKDQMYGMISRSSQYVDSLENIDDVIQQLRLEVLVLLLVLLLVLVLVLVLVLLLLLVLLVFTKRGR